MGPFVLGSTPIFGAEKHWLAAFATVAAFAGIGAVWAGRAAGAVLDASAPGRSTRTGTAVAVVVGLACGGAALATVRAQPYALTHYNALAGGAAGGADLGMNRQFWGYAARGVLSWLNDNAPGTAGETVRVYAHDASPAWSTYHRSKALDLRLADSGREQRGVADSRFAIVIHERHFNRHDFMVWREYGTVKPAFVLRAGGVPIVSVYERPAASAAPRPRQ